MADEAELDAVALSMAETIASAPAFTVKMARRTISSLGRDEVQRSIDEEAVAQSMVFASSDYAEMKAARAADRVPRYRRAEPRRAAPSWSIRSRDPVERTTAGHGTAPRRRRRAPVARRRPSPPVHPHPSTRRENP